MLREEISIIEIMITEDKPSRGN